MCSKTQPELEAYDVDAQKSTMFLNFLVSMELGCEKEKEELQRGRATGTDRWFVSVSGRR